MSVTRSITPEIHSGSSRVCSTAHAVCGSPYRTAQFPYSTPALALQLRLCPGIGCAAAHLDVQHSRQVVAGCSVSQCQVGGTCHLYAAICG